MNPVFSYAVGAGAFSVSAFTSLSVSSEPDYSDIVATHVTPAIEAELIPGAVVGIYKDGETSYYPIGTLEYDQDQAPTSKTLYEIGSISKVITGVLFADAVRRGEVSRDSFVNDLLPEGFKVQSKEEEDLKLWHLTTHTSGWATAPINIAPTDGDRPFTGYTQEMMFEAVNLMAPKQAPGTRFEYSNFAVGLLGTLVSLNADGEYEALVKERIIQPLGIENFTIELDEDQLRMLAPATASGMTVKAWGKTGPIDPAGMWVTNTPGLLKFAVANMKKFDDSGEDITESLRLAREPLYKSESMGQQICSGWFIARDGQGYWHNGMTGGYSSYMGLTREMDLAVVVLTNGKAFETTIIGEKILQAVAGMNPDPIEIEVAEKLDIEYTDRLVGVYHSAMGFDMTVTASRGKLFAQITGQQALRLSAVSAHRFKYKLVDAEIEFELPEEGEASSVTLFQNGMEIKCERKED